MQCPNCGAPATEGDVFCGSCGATLAPAAEPTQPMPQQPATPQPTQVMPQVAQQPYQQPYQQPAPGGYAPGPGATMPPPSSSKTGLIVTLSIVGVLLVIGLAVGGFFAWRAFSASDDTTTATTPTTQAPAPATDPAAPAAEPVGSASAELALAGYLPADWVSDVLTDEGDMIEYIIGPPNSEFVEVVVVARQPDGSWLVEDSYAYDTGDMEGDGAMSAEDEALQVVGEFIYAVQEDRADDAHALTISPFAEDPASAQYSNGDLDFFEITRTQLQSDGTTVWVWSSEQWSWGTESYIYVCVPTANGYRISDLRIP